MVFGRDEGAAGEACGLVDRRLGPRPVGAVVAGVTAGVSDVDVFVLADGDALDTSVVSANHPAIATNPPAPIAPVMRRARRAGCGRERRVVSMRDIIEPQSHDTLGAPWVSASITLSVVRPPIAAAATMNAVRRRNVSLSVPAVTPCAVARMNNGKLR